MVSTFKFKPSKEDRRLVFYLTRTKICLRHSFLNPIYWFPTRNTWAEKIQNSSSFNFKIVFSFLLSQLNFDICCSFVALRNKGVISNHFSFCGSLFLHLSIMLLSLLEFNFRYTYPFKKKIKNMFTFKGKFYQSIT